MGVLDFSPCRDAQFVGSRALADRLRDVLLHAELSDTDKAFIEGCGFFFLATADADGRPDCSFKGGPVGFVQVVSPTCLIFPDYDGNRMYKSIGNISANPEVGMLFISLGKAPRRLRLNGTAFLRTEHPLLDSIPGAQMIVQVTPREIFPNCPRYIPNLADEEPSIFLPASAQAPVEPSWKSRPEFASVVPKRVR
jgi:predicted pyridoxine 5'-phosphate oxidase superfamily flavin-nucleotide-binding protein